MCATLISTAFLARNGCLLSMDPLRILAVIIALEMAFVVTTLSTTNPLLLDVNALLTLLDLTVRQCVKLVVVVMENALMGSVRAMMAGLDKVADGRNVHWIAMTMDIAEMECVCARMAILVQNVASLLMKRCRISVSSTVPLTVSRLVL